MSRTLTPRRDVVVSVPAGGADGDALVKASAADYDTEWAAAGTGSVPDATTSTKGKVELATDGETAAGVVVQGNDARLSNARTPTSHTHAESDITGLTSDLAAKATPADITAAVSAHEAASDPHAGYQRESEKAQANGYASLGADGKVPTAQLPASSGGISQDDALNLGFFGM